MKYRCSYRNRKNTRENAKKYKKNTKGTVYQERSKQPFIMGIEIVRKWADRVLWNPWGRNAGKKATEGNNNGPRRKSYPLTLYPIPDIVSNKITQANPKEWDYRHKYVSKRERRKKVQAQIFKFMPFMWIWGSYSRYRCQPRLHFHLLEASPAAGWQRISTQCMSWTWWFPSVDS